MKNILGIAFFVLVCSGYLFGQKSTIYVGVNKTYRDAIDLFDKEKFVPAQKKFEEVIASGLDINDEFVLQSKYYRAVCSMELHHADAEFLFKEFLKLYPESPRIQSVYFKLGNLFYRKKQ